MLSYLLIACLLLYTEAHPGNRRMKRDEEIGGVTYAPCKDTYAQCPEWKRNGMCEMPQYKDYMPLVCTDTCGFCKGIQKRKSEITAPTIIDATEDGDNNNNPVISFTDISDHPRSKIHTGARLKAVPKAEIKEVPKEEAGSGESESESDEESESESEEGSAKPADKKTNIKDKHNAANYKKDKKNAKPVVADKKDNIVDNKTAKKSIKEKSKVTSAKGKVTANKKSKVTSLVKKDKDKKESKHVSKEKSEVSELMSEKGDTAAVRNKKLEKKSSTGVVKKPMEGMLSSRKDIPRNKEEPLSASVVITYSKRGKSTKKPAAEKKVMKSIGTEATIADLSGAGSGEMDTDMLSGDGSYRSLVESGDDNDGLEEGEEDEQDFSEAHHMTGHHSSDPEKIHITPQANVQKQPDLNDFPAGRHKESAKHKESKGSFKEETQSTVTEAEAEARTDNSTGTEEGAEEATAETTDAAQEEAPVAAEPAAEAEGETAEAATETADALPEATETAEAGTETAEAAPEAGGVEENEQDGGEINDVKIEELLSPNEDKKEKKLNKEKEKSLNEGKISMVLSQNFNEHYGRKESPSYQMLAGNIKKDIEKMIKGAAVKDLAFSEVSVEGNPRQSGKTKVSFNVDASNNEWMKKLLKLVDGGDIDGLRVIKGSLEIEEEKKKK